MREGIWCYGFVVLRFCGVLVLRCCGFVVFWFVVLWSFGFTVLWSFGLWFYGVSVLWSYGFTPLWFFERDCSINCACGTIHFSVSSEKRPLIFSDLRTANSEFRTAFFAVLWFCGVTVLWCYGFAANPGICGLTGYAGCRIHLLWNEFWLPDAILFWSAISVSISSLCSR